MMPRLASTFLAAVLLCIPVPALRAQDHADHAGHETAATDRLEIPHAREGSGTGWVPDAVPMMAHHARAGAWDLMLHENVFLHYIDETSERGGRHFGSINWVMGMLRRDLAGGRVSVRGMASLEPLTVGKCGYPNLLQTGELCNGRPIVNGQHPHDLFMELAGSWERGLGRSLGVQLYAAVVGEPALGPVAFPHRPSAAWMPVAPIGHHWLDASHISFGVATLGFYGRSWKVEGSAFNGREPDEDRYGLDMGPLDSWAGRLTVLPGERWAFQVSAGHLTDAHLHVGVPTPGRLLCPANVACHPLGQLSDITLDVVRVTASILHHRPIGRDGGWDTAIVWGRNEEDGHRPTQAFLVETSLVPDGRHAFFARVERVQKSDHDLAIPLAGDVDVYEETVFPVYKWSAGAARRLPDIGIPTDVSLGVGASVINVPEELEATYGDRSAVGWFGFLRISPRPSAHAH